MTLIDSWLEAKYTGNQPDDDRFKDTRGEYHASNISNCPREWYWQFKEEGEDTWSPYFELGRMYEQMYGRALQWQFGERARQDVNVEIHLDDDIVIVGESDWVVFEDDAPCNIAKVKLTQDDERVAVLDDGTERPYKDEIMKVIETKTTKSVGSKKQYGYSDSHLYQLQTYMWTFDTPGEIVYMERNDASEVVFEFERNASIEQDMEIRVRRHHRNLLNDSPPDTDPLNPQWDCKWCDHKDRCKVIGGSRWE